MPASSGIEEIEENTNMARKSLCYLRFGIALILVTLLLAGCGGDKKSDKAKTYTVGVLIQAQSLASVFDGLKAGMTELGYVEGKNVTYLYDGPTGTIEGLKPAAESLKSRKPDLVFTVGTPPALAAKEVFAGTDVPILFAPVFNPDKEGLVASFRNPGGNLTGVNPTDTIGKALGWLIEIVPGVKRIYVPSNPQEGPAVQSLQSLTDAAKTEGVELVVSEGSTPEELDAITQTIPENVDAVFVLRSDSVDGRIDNIIQAANERRIPAVSSDIGGMVAAGAMVGYGCGFSEMGEQAARMADKILKGADPATLPVENAESYLGINLQTAQTIGIEVPDSILNQAKQIVRPPAQ
jgi:putative ABC transport system substrate-binding protein